MAWKPFKKPQTYIKIFGDPGRGPQFLSDQVQICSGMVRTGPGRPWILIWEGWGRVGELYFLVVGGGCLGSQGSSTIYLEWGRGVMFLFGYRGLVLLLFAAWRCFRDTLQLPTCVNNCLLMNKSSRIHVGS